MQLHLSGPRSLAMGTAAGLLGWWINNDEVTQLAHYRTLSHEALLAELAQTTDGGLATKTLAAAAAVAIIVFAVDWLTGFYEAVWARLSGPAARKPNEPAA